MTQYRSDFPSKPIPGNSGTVTSRMSTIFIGRLYPLRRCCMPARGFPREPAAHIIAASGWSDLMPYMLLIVEDPAQRATRTQAEGQEVYQRMGHRRGSLPGPLLSLIKVFTDSPRLSISQPLLRRPD